MSDLTSCVDGLLPLLAHFLSASLKNSLAEGQQPRVRTSANQELDGLVLKDSCGGSSRNSSSCDLEDFVMVPAHFPSKDPEAVPLSSSLLFLNASCVAAAEGLQDSLLSSG